MKTIVNDEINVQDELTKDRKPSCKLRFCDVGHGRMILEQLWISDYQGIENLWVPVPLEDKP